MSTATKTNETNETNEKQAKKSVWRAQTLWLNPDQNREEIKII